MYKKTLVEFSNKILNLIFFSVQWTFIECLKTISQQELVNLSGCSLLGLKNNTI